MNIFRPACLTSKSSTCARKCFVGSFKDAQRGRAIHSKKPPKTVIVRLIKPTRSYGDEGAVVPVSLGYMRNRWFPQRVADYLTRSEFEAVKKNRGLESIKRDFEFGKNWDKEDTKAKKIYGEDSEAQKLPRKHSAIEGLQLSPQRVAELLQVLVPTKLHFHRQLIQAPVSADVSSDDTIPSRSSNHTSTSIYGSVSSLDVLNSIRSVLANNEEASRINLSEGDIRFLNVRGDDDKRLKHLGEFLINIFVSGLPEGQSIKKVVKVSSSSSDKFEAEEANQ